MSTAIIIKAIGNIRWRLTWIVTILHSLLYARVISGVFLVISRLFLGTQSYFKIIWALFQGYFRVNSGLFQGYLIVVYHINYGNRSVYCTSISRYKNLVPALRVISRVRETRFSFSVSCSIVSWNVKTKQTIVLRCFVFDLAPPNQLTVLETLRWSRHGSLITDYASLGTMALGCRGRLRSETIGHGSMVSLCVELRAVLVWRSRWQ